jgi:hypothetical protein
LAAILVGGRRGNRRCSEPIREGGGEYSRGDEVSFRHAVSAVRLAKKHRKAGKLSSEDYKRIRRKATRS